LYAVYASRKFVPPKLRTFIDFIVEFLSPPSEPKPRHFQAPGPLLNPPCTSTAEPRLRRKALTSLGAAL